MSPGERERTDGDEDGEAARLRGCFEDEDRGGKSVRATEQLRVQCELARSQLIVMPSTVLIGDCGHEGNVIDPVAMLINKVTKSHE